MKLVDLNFFAFAHSEFCRVQENRGPQKNWKFLQNFLCSIKRAPKMISQIYIGLTVTNFLTQTASLL